MKTPMKNSEVLALAFSGAVTNRDAARGKLRDQAARQTCRL